jgi:hypothetical protein
MPQATSNGLRLRTSLTLAALCVAMAACGGGGGGGGTTPPAPAPTPTPTPPPPPPAPTNTAPTAVISNVANGQIVGQPITINALSTDPDAGQTLTHTWALTTRPGGSTAALSSTTGASITLTPDVVGNYAVRLVSNDGIAESTPAATRSFTVVAANLAPTASIGGTTAGFRAGQVLTLNATSTDPESQPLTHTWSLTTQAGGNTGALSSTTGNSITFRPTAAGGYTIRLVSSDGVNNSTPATVNFTIAANNAPTAIIQATTTGVISGQTVNFTAASTDPESEPLTHTWAVTAQPAGGPDALSATSGTNVSLRPTRPGSYTVSLVSSDGISNSPAATRTFSVTGNAVPTGAIGLAVSAGNAGTGQLATGGTATLTANSTDSDNSPSPLTHAWSITGAPAGSSAALSAASGSPVTFAPTVPGTYTIRLVSNDGLNDSTPVTRTVTLNQAPTAGFTVTGSNGGATIRVGETVTLASTALDPEGQLLTLTWSFGTVPATSAAALSSTTTTNTTFVPDLPGAYQVRLTVNDGVNPAVQTPITAVTVVAQPATVACANPGGFAQGTPTRFNPAVAGTVPTAVIGGAPVPVVSTGSSGTNAGNSACFHRTLFEAVKGSDTISTGSFQYFEVRRSRVDDQIAIGVAPAALNLARTASNTWPASPSNDNQYVVVEENRVTTGSRATFDLAFGTNVFGIAVDYRDRHPVVSVIGPPEPSRLASLPPHCLDQITPTRIAKAQCVVGRYVINTTAPVRVFAYGRDSDPGTGDSSQVTINGGESAGYGRTAYQIREALRSRLLDADAGLNPQLTPAGSGGTALASPTVTRAAGSPLKTVVLEGAGAQFSRTALTVTPSGGATVTWLAPNGASLNAFASGAASETLNLLTARATLTGGAVLPAGGTTYRIEAVTSVGAGTNVMTATVPFLVTIGPATDSTFDHDGDGRTHAQELAAIPPTDPADQDTDGDGIADGVVLASTGAGRTQLTREAGITSAGVRFTEDGLSVALTSELNPECVLNPPYGEGETCNKRGVRANAGVPQGEFRYFEVTNKLPGSPNMGAGVISSAAYTLTTPSPFPGMGQLDPYCCFVVSAPLPVPQTPVSSTFNYQAGFWRRLDQQQPWTGGAGSPTIGVAIDYRSAGQVTVHYVWNNGGTPTVSNPIIVTGFGLGSTAIPFVFGHPQNLVEVGGVNIGDIGIAQEVNFGLKPFVYDAGGLFRLRNLVPGGSAIVPGIGVNARPLTP